MTARLERSWSREEREDGLRHLVVLGNAEMAAEKTGIPARTLRRWREEHATRFYEIDRVYRTETEGAVAAKLRELAHHTIDAASDAVKLEHERIKAGNVKDAAASARNLVVTGATGIDKIFPLEDRPTAVVEHRGIADMLQSIAHRWPSAMMQEAQAIDGTCEEITE